ncbi:hypothetical protein VI817_010058 [Penicillium citrinum]|nr:hypothetical protein VI817_010058 [Penicillium citrinum]
MSGFEIVGVVLGVFPLLIEGVKFCTDETGFLNDIFHYEHVLRRIGRSVSREQALFRTSCERFMEDIASQCGAGEDEVAEMMKNASDPRWRYGKLCTEDIFSQKSVQEYLETVEDMSYELDKVKDVFAKYGDGDQSGHSYRKVRRRQWKKIILAIKKDDINRSLDEAARLNRFLVQLTQQNQPALPSRRRFPSQCSTRHYSLIRAHAIDLYEILQERFPSSPSCNCLLRHDVNMKLEFRSAKTLKEGLFFRTIFTSDMALSSPRNWRELELEPWENIETSLCREPPHNTRVKFTIVPSSSSASKISYQNISDLCATVMMPRSSQDWLGLIANRKGIQHRIRAIDYRMRSPSFQCIEIVTLAEVLQDPSFGQEHRYRVGLKLASTVMQLHATAWLTDYWSKHDIAFFRSQDGKVDFGSPFIRRHFQTFDLTGLADNLPKTRPIASIPCLFSLGIVLLELWYREQFDNLKNDYERNMPSEFSDHVASRRLVEEMDCLPNYKHSVLRCLFGVDAAYNSLVEDKLRDEVQEKILLPLEEDLKFYCAKESIEDCM